MSASRFVLLFQSAFFALLLSACGGSSSNNAAPETPRDDDPEIEQPGPEACSDEDFMLLPDTGRSPADGATDVPLNSSLLLRFNAPVDPASVSDSSIMLSGPGAPLLDFDIQGSSVTATPGMTLQPDTEYTLTLTTALRDLTGNALEAPVQARFRTGGLLVQLNEEVLRQIPGLGDGFDLVAGQLFSALGISQSDDGLGGLDNLLVLTLPIISPLSQLDPAGIPDGTTTLVAICNPATPGERCTLSLELNVNPLALTGFARAVADGDPAEALQQIANALITTEGLLGLELSLLEPGFEALLPGPLGDAVAEVLTQVQQGLAAVPLSVLSELLGQGTEPLLRVGLLNGSLLSLGSADGLSNAPAGILAALLVALAGDFSQGFSLDGLPLGPLGDLLPF